MAATKVYLEQGKKTTFALALDWPGWARHARTPELALEELALYQSRYETMLGHELPTSTFRVIATVTGTATTDFGAPSIPGPGDDKPFRGADRQRQIDVLERCWRYFDEVVATSSPLLAKGPRGGVTATRSPTTCAKPNVPTAPRSHSALPRERRGSSNEN